MEPAESKALVLEFSLESDPMVVRGEEEVDAGAEPFAFIAVSSLIV